MEQPKDNKTNFLLESIRKELVSIIEDGVSDEVQNNYTAVKQTNIHSPSVDKDAGRSTVNGEQNSSFGNIHGIDDDLQMINGNLNESYELFQTIGERFENINFGCLKSRIKDLHLTDKTNENIKNIVRDLKNSFDQKYLDNRLVDLTKEVGTKFRRHPGEFGDIPELSEFFKACTQLQHGLEKLKTQRNEVQDITKRMGHLVEMSYDRISEIQKNVKIESSKEQ